MSPSSVASRLTQLEPEEARPRFTPAELQEYFQCITLPQAHLDSIVLKDSTQASRKKHGFPLLRALVLHHTSHVPFENLELHYSAQKKITLNPEHLYDKFVRRRRGGRCMENNTFFATVLRSIGYVVRNCAGRVAREMSPYAEVRENQQRTYDGWNHMLNLVRLDEEWYVVDVGMGSMGPNLPYPLDPRGFEQTSIAPRKIRLQLRPIEESYAPPESAPKLWCYDVCYDPGRTDKKWVPVYCFTETEFLPQDYETMSWFTSTHPSSFFTKSVTCTKMILNEKEEKIIGNTTLFGDTIRESIGAERKVIKECRSEEERIQALSDLFGVRLTEEEKNGISSEMKLGSD